MVRPDPAQAARAIAQDLHAELAIGGEETERALERMWARQLEHRDLDGLAAAMRRAEAIRDRTREVAAERLSASLNTKLAIHPDTLRRAAAELLAAEAALAMALEQDRRRRTRRTRVGALGTTTCVAAGAAVGVVILPVAGAAAAAASLVGGGALVRRARRTAEDPHTSLRAHGELARRRWEQVAGVGADPAQVDETIHRYDPQDRLIGALVEESPAVRAAERVAVERRMAWVSAWRKEVGDETPIADPTITALLHRDRTELWLTEGTSLAEELDTLVVAAPYADLPDVRARELHRRLLGLPRTQRVIVVLAPDPEAPTGGQIPGVGWVPAVAGG